MRHAVLTVELSLFPKPEIGWVPKPKLVDGVALEEGEKLVLNDRRLVKLGSALLSCVVLRDTCDPLADLSTGLIPGAGLSMEANEMSDDAESNVLDGDVRVEVFSKGANGAGG